MPQTSRTALTVAALALLAAVPARAQQVATPTDAKAVDEKAFKVDAPGTYANADLSYVLTSGNSTANSLGFKGDVTHRWARHSIGFAAGGLRASSSPDLRYAVGTPGDFEIVIPEAETTAEYYYGRGRYDYKLSDRLYLHGGRGLGAEPLLRPRQPVAGGHRPRLHLPQQRPDELPRRGRDHLHDEQYTVDDGQRRLVPRRAARLGLPAEALLEHDLHPHPARGREPRGHGRPPRWTPSSACTWPCRASSG